MSLPSHAAACLCCLHAWAVCSLLLPCASQGLLGRGTYFACERLWRQCARGRRHVQVYANDLNPRSHHWLAVNIKLNKARRLAIPWPLEAHAAVPEGPGLLLLRRRCLT